MLCRTVALAICALVFVSNNERSVSVWRAKIFMSLSPSVFNINLVIRLSWSAAARNCEGLVPINYYVRIATGCCTIAYTCIALYPLVPRRIQIKPFFSFLIASFPRLIAFACLPGAVFAVLLWALRLGVAFNGVCTIGKIGGEAPTGDLAAFQILEYVIIAAIFVANTCSIVLARRSKLRRLLPDAFLKEISYLTATSVFLAVFDMLFRAGWIHDAINDATENNATARANGRTALNTIFLIVFMNIMSAYTLFFMDRDRIRALPRRLQHPFSLGFWRLGRAAGVMLMDATRILEATQRMETVRVLKKSMP